MKIIESHLEAFNPKAIPYQYKVIYDIRKRFSYDQGPHEILLSGAVGSAKSLLMAHIGATHCILYPGAHLLVGRRVLGDAKSTICQEILNHIKPVMVEGKDFTYNKTSGDFEFANGSKITTISWADKNYQKFRSYPFSAAIIEELTENDSIEAKEMHNEMIGRIGRVNAKNAGVMENFVLYATNPDAPSHWAYTYFIIGAKTNPLRHVFYSRTRDNPFLPDWYEKSLRAKYDAKQIERMLEGRWTYIESDVVYYEYSPDIHWGHEFEIDKDYPLHISYDFNIGKGKPMSSTLFQDHKKNTKRKRRFRFHDEVIVEGARTLSTLEEWAGRGYFDLPHNPPIIIHGDATGRSKDTRSPASDYDIIEKFLANYERKDREPLEFEIDVPRRNPGVKTRHNCVNGLLKNADGVSSIEVHKRCVTINEGMLKVKLKDGGQYVEDDGPAHPYQHVTTAVGYGLKTCLDNDDVGTEIRL